MQTPKNSPTQSVEAARYYNAGVQHLRSDDPEEKKAAVGCFCLAIELDPSFDEAWFNRAIGLQSLGHHEDAVSDLQALVMRGSPMAAQLTQLFAILPDVYTQLGDRSFNAGDPSLAIEYYTAAIIYGPQFAEPYEARARTYRSLGQDRLAKDDEDNIAKIRSSSSQ
ncbi:tetratricopeptide repeat protein [Lacipirellula limnantheis]|uniref:Tetratricopeptide repeat protein n=1 Tax=Lacipirellula limnantheis TaxID=2528024 RepID=A0A517TRT4_9BACT|nr:hypothetical protein [Lacipirellula limnantheis]QDT71092.1 Tetratricopeptide repeat protein [Lacipirellula limnantheis]